MVEELLNKMSQIVRIIIINYMTTVFEKVICKENSNRVGFYTTDKRLVVTSYIELHLLYLLGALR